MYEIVLSDIILCRSTNSHDVLIKYLDLLKKIIVLTTNKNILINHLFVRYTDDQLFINKIKYFYDIKEHCLKSVNLYTNKVVHYNNIDETLNNKLIDLNINSNKNVKTKKKESIIKKLLNKPKHIKPDLETKIPKNIIDYNEDDEDNNTESESSSTTTTEEINYINIDKLDIESLDEKTYKKLEQNLQLLNDKRDEHINSLKNLKDSYSKDITNYIDYKSEINDKNTKKRLLEEKLEEQKRIFISERDYTYKKIKQSITDGKMKEDDISPLFIKKYSIFKFMDENNTLYNEDSHTIFSSLKTKLNESNDNMDDNDETYIPHNYNYLEENEKKLYENKKNTDVLEEVVNKNTYEPLEKIEDTLDKMEQDEELL